ncbi:MAG: biotin/lipoyl-binding protein [Flammeovirgaceae bacterium]
MKKQFYTNPFLVLLVAALAVACGGEQNDKAAQLKELKGQQAEIAKKVKALEAEIAKTDPAAENVKTKDVSVAELQPRPFDHFVQTQGTVEAIDNILVSAKTVGIITQVFVREGDVVSKGQTLAQIDNALTLRGIEEVKSGLELATTVYNRQKKSVGSKNRHRGTIPSSKKQ